MKPGELQVALVFRADLPTMVRAKSEIQAAHAGMELAHRLSRTHTDLLDVYMANAQPKVNLEVDGLEGIAKVIERAERRGVPYLTITDEGRTCFDGPTLTCVIVGPMERTNSNNVTRGLRKRDPAPPEPKDLTNEGIDA